MIRLLHFADLHLGVENYGRLDPNTGLSTRLMDFLNAFDFVVDYAIREEIDLVLFAGDAFKNRDPSPTHQREFARRLRQLSAAEIPTFLLVGNHDLPNAIKRAHAIEIFHTLETPYVTVAERPGVHRVETKRGPVQIAALPWVTRSHLLSREAYSGLSMDEIRAKIEESVGQILTGFAEQIDDEVPAILTAHGSVSGATFGTERSVMLGQDVLLQPSLLKDPRFDYVAMGHIHKHQSLNEQPPIVYSGSIERIDFGEANEAKGFVVAEIGDGPTRWEFVETPTRPFYQLTIDVRDATDPMTLIRERLAEESFDDAVVKLVIRASFENEGHLDNREIRRLLEPAAHIAAIVPEVERPHRPRIGTVDEIARAGPRELMERYFEAREVAPERREQLLERADRIFAEDEQEA